MNLKEHFVKYEALVQMVDAVFDRVKKEFPKEVFCREKCSDCCYAIFDLTLIEALYLKDKFLKNFTGKAKSDLIEVADKTDRVLTKMKRNAYKEIKKGSNELEIVGKMSQERVRCPLLGEDNLCVMYENRPITCRVYGIPTSTAGVSHICGRTNFIQGQPYPTLNMDKIYTQLQLFSAQLVKDIKSSNIKMHEMLIPVSMAVVTKFDEDYLGVRKSE
ncbi:MAG: YkgJ family cysteine cluster protein [Desulfobacula sp.]|jgi:Fe-S-cluster containining protein|uniref:YkgJ family cysteine cluster protein n=1 Tax=Desulfobacula sp. TaxID=2593537 RepID=UPI001DFCE990|nr:YkgJ family cysteine cluster protein [Desulfobacula sp.]MBT3485631.1 YkgJ family cysteine cluster protein [Desulfobacula sp.]MBT3805534.1 YkgJ family cysteine cluster protein [Desulfobacula sp.]MBT4024803.1 YkgJ family cysteine cluster protein [Desulfobacula sp.]MBT4200091.1 YkgJ family cysteine cluster protein [Desulfobacula sp.]